MPNYGGYNFTITSTITPGAGINTTGGGGFNINTNMMGGATYPSAGTFAYGGRPTVPPTQRPNTPSYYNTNTATSILGNLMAGGASGGTPTGGLKPQDRRSIDEEHAGQQYEWDTYHKAQQEGFAKQIEQEAMDSANRALADAAARYGWQRSAGAGTAGMWEMGQYALEGKALQLRSSISALNAQYMRDQYNLFMNTEDKEAYGYQMLRLQEVYKEKYAAQIAELNEPSWWQQIGSIVGSMAAMLGGGIPTQYGVGDFVKGVGYRLS